MTSRSIPVASRAALEREGSPILLLAFLTIRHPNLAEPVRLVSDWFDYEKGGETFQGFPFAWRPLSDDDRAGRAELTVSNISPDIGRAIDRLDTRPELDLEICSGEDFDLTVEPRAEQGTATPHYAYTAFEAISVTADATEIRASVALREIDRLPWPYILATEVRCPGLFR